MYGMSVWCNLHSVADGESENLKLEASQSMLVYHGSLAEHTYTQVHKVSHFSMRLSDFSTLCSACPAVV